MSKVKTYLDDEDVCVQIELMDDRLFIHMQVKKWNKRVANKLLEGQVRLNAQAKACGVKRFFTYNKNECAKWYKFMQFVGYSPLPKAGGMTVFVREL